VGLPAEGLTADLPASDIPREEKVVTGSFYGSCDPQVDMPAVVDLYMDGQLPLDRLRTRQHPPGGVNGSLGGDDLRRGRARRDHAVSQVLISEGFAGEGPNAAHINTVLGLREGPV